MSACRGRRKRKFYVESAGERINLPDAVFLLRVERAGRQVDIGKRSSAHLSG
jgi:hypothetical protein